MKVPMRWLKEYLDSAPATRDYASKMVLSGTGVEGIETTGADFAGVVAGHILSVTKHPDSDHLQICQVDVGEDEPVQIVTGAPNIQSGDTVPVALAGAKLPGGEIKPGVLRGVASNGMLCSGPELNVPEGLYPHCGDKGILIFQEEQKPGTDVHEIFGLGDEVVDFEILANRPDCLSVWGIARESAAVLDVHCVLPEIAVEETGEGKFADYATVRVEDDVLCPRYCARVVQNVKIGPSPKWMRAYLHAAGVRPINNIVDITNFVMLETGHPMHAFDLAKVREHTIVVRRAQPGETLTTLDGKEHALTADMLVIADHERPTGLAGVMGGEESEITEGTQNVLFECAAFDRTSIRLTSRALGIRTESSGRFERGVCPDTALEALERACMLVNMLDCGSVVPEVFDHYAQPMEKRLITASVSRIARLISADLPGTEMQDTLEKLYIETELDGDTLTCLVPAWRGDIEGEADLGEEILRLYGYEHIPSTLMRGVTMVGKRSDAQTLNDRLRETLVGMGFYEAYNFSFVTPKWAQALNLPEGDRRLSPVVIRNPLGEDTSVMRTSLAPSMLNTLSLNISRGNPGGKLFEIGPVFLPKAGEQLPEEHPMLSLGMYGEGVDFYTLKDAVVCLLARFGLEAVALPGGDPFYHPGRKANLSAYGRRLAQLGEAHPDAAARFGIEGTRVYLAEIDLSALLATQRPIPNVKPLPKYPSVARDIALVVEEKVAVGPLMEVIRTAAGKALENVQLFDIYRGAQIGMENKSVAFALTFRSAEGTMTDKETQSLMEAVASACEKSCGAKIRK